MKKKKKLLLGIIAILLLSLVCIVWWQQNNVTAIINAVSNSSEEIEKKIDKNKKELEDALTEYAPNIIRDFTLEEEEQIRSGKLSEEEAIKKIINEKKRQITDTSDKKLNNQEIDNVIGDHVTKMYGLKAHYIRQLGIIESQVINEYIALPKNQQNLSDKKKIVSKYIGQAASLESQCDSQVEEVLSSLKYKLNELDGDASIINIIRDAYANEKSLKKAYYFKILNN